MKIKDLLWDQKDRKYESTGVTVRYYDVYYHNGQWWATGDDDEGHNYFRQDVESAEAGKDFCNEDNKKRIMEWVHE